jgi:hypothetical protein
MNFTALISQNTTLKLKISVAALNASYSVRESYVVVWSRNSLKWKNYTLISSKFKEFLLQTSTEDSLTEYEAFNAATDNKRN